MGEQIACLGEQKTTREASGTAARADRGSVDRMGGNFGPKCQFFPTRCRWELFFPVLLESAAALDKRHFTQTVFVLLFVLFF